MSSTNNNNNNKANNPSPNNANNNNNNNRNNNNKNKKKGQNNNAKRNNSSNNTATKFKGKTEELKGHLYDCSNQKQSDQFVTTTCEIAEYVGRTYKYVGDIKATLEKLDIFQIDLPPQPDDPDDALQKLIYTKEAEEHVKRRVFLCENMKTAYSLIWGQCSDLMRVKVQAHKEYDNFNKSQDPVELLKAIKSINFKFEDHKYIFHSVFEAYRSFYVF